MPDDEPMFDCPQLEHQRDPCWPWWLPLVLVVVVCVVLAVSASLSAALQ